MLSNYHLNIHVCTHRLIMHHGLSEKLLEKKKMVNAETHSSSKCQESVLIEYLGPTGIARTHPSKA